MTNSAVIRFFGERMKYSKFVIEIEDRLVFFYKPEVPMTVADVENGFLSEFGTSPGNIIFTADNLTLSNGKTIKDVSFSTDSLPLSVKAIPLGS